MEECRYFKTCSTVMERFNTVDAKNTEQEVKLKALYEQRRDDAIVRKEMNGKLDVMHDTLLEHLTWEEQTNRARDKRDARSLQESKERLTNYKWLFLIVFSVVSAISTYTITTVNSNKEAIAVGTNDLGYVGKHLDDIDTTLRDLNNFIRGKEQ